MKFLCKHAGKLASGKKKEPCKDCPRRRQWEQQRRQAVAIRR